ncbi:hypothetical protein OC861_002258 [Tilletia horrida]|nr:hypothetical protein OC861_002258 [Tilletia horrida]
MSTLHEASFAQALLPTSLRSPYAPLQSPPTAERPLHVVLACSGSVASVKSPLILESLLSHENVMVHLIPTQHATHFWSAAELDNKIRPLMQQTYAQDSSSSGSRNYGVKELAEENKAARSTAFSDAQGPPSQGAFKMWSDEDEWSQWKRVGDPVLHIELRRWADIVLLAPCDANTLAKLANGICDNLLTSFFRALSPSTPTLIFPAMNTLMYEHPLTSRHLEVLTSLLGYEVHGPIPKRLACGDLGQGAMFEWSDIVSIVVERFGLVPRAEQ